MDNRARELIHTAATGSAAGTLHFGQVLALLAEAGVEAYDVDYRAARTTYYRGSEALDLPLEMHEPGIGELFDATALKAAIRGSQQGVVRYPEFKRLSSRAGCVGYTVWLAGRHVSYFGRRGEVHVERFPD